MHPAYQMPASFRGTGRSLASAHMDMGNVI
jgi:hypothetical protein